LVSRDDPDYTLLIDRLIAGLRHDSPKVRYRCAGALDHFGDARCIAPLRVLVADPVPRVRRMALHALSCEVCKLAPLPGDTDLVGLLADYALHDPSINVRRHATYGLASRRDDPRAAAVLEQLRGNVASSDARAVSAPNRGLSNVQSGKSRRVGKPTIDTVARWRSTVPSRRHAIARRR